MNLFKKSTLSLALYPTEAPVPVETPNASEFYTILTLMTLDHCRLYGRLAWHTWHRDEDLEEHKDYIACKYAKQIIRLELSHHTLDEYMTRKNKMITGLLRIAELPPMNFWKAVNAILDDPTSKELLPQ